ncbi:MAG TPA: tRNA (adenosine(37)-N6)-threonylcarbamoyltransferase complex dimerization subunit type 1 TsaB [Desulfobulbaceae bacterium]|nr:tRNA (adenosine(37)-N6)-threonylcarbamoyltransferase complex dimerization subunit type 1 TsaB [Desulfobulbaceae bacterium]
MDGFLILSIETSTGCGSIALTRGERLLAETTTQPEVTHSRRLLGTVSWLMKAVAVEWSDLDGIGVSLGPGSFTGLRIGMAAAKGLAMAAGVPLFGVETLDALALSCSSVAEQICPVLDARKQEVYAAMYQPGEDGYPLRLTGDQALAPELLADSIDRPTVLAGPAVAVYGELFRKNTLIRVVPAPLAHPRGLYVGLLACRMLATGQNMDPATATPKYVRASEAEITLRKKEGIE